MNEKIKKEVLKVLSAALFLFVTIVFVLPYMVQISTFFHEKAHMEVLDKNGIENYYYINLFKTIPNFFNPKTEALGVTKFNLAEYEKLDKYKRTELHIAGIVSDLRLLFLVGVYLASVNVYIFYKVKVKKETNLTYALAINWILFMWLLVLIQISISNITFSSGDIYQLVRFLRL